MQYDIKVESERLYRVKMHGGANTADTLHAITSVLSAGGWELYDSHAVNNGRCFRAPMRNGTLYKYVVAVASGISVQLLPYESWDEETHKGLNLCEYTDTCYISFHHPALIFISPRYIIAYNDSGRYGITGGTIITEYSCDHVDEPLDDCPRFGHTYPPRLFGGHMTQKGGRNPGYNCFCPPRLPDVTSEPATQITTGIAGSHNYCYSWDYTHLMSHIVLPAKSFFDPAKVLAYDMYLIRHSSRPYAAPYRPLGRLYGLKVVSTAFDKSLIDLRVNDDGFLDPKKGVQKRYMIIGSLAHPI